MPRRKKQPAPTVEDVTAGSPGGGAEAAAPATPAAEIPQAAGSGAEERRRWAAGPSWFKAVSLSDERGGPKVDLGRDHKYKQMAIRFPEKPEREVIDALHGAGWAWRNKERYWTKQLDAGRPAASQQEAEEFFDALAAGMRARRGLGESPAVG